MQTATVSPPARRVRDAAPPGAFVGAPWYLHAVVFASVSVVLGVLWDISWHQTIGRDTLFSPPHLAMYLGGVVAGVVCGWLVLHITLAGTPEERAASVSWWRFFRGPLGAWTCIWGAFAMITSAPFDDWWHNAYGLDVEILSPPHVVLALGILAIQIGALLMVLARQNRSEAPGAAGTAPTPEQARAQRTLRWMYVVAAGLVLMNFAVLVSEYTWRIFQHGSTFFQVASLAFPVVLAAAAVAGRVRWPAAATAAVYMGILLLLVWIFPLFPAEPKLAPVRFPIRQMMPPQYPLLLVVPALAFDLILKRWTGRRGWLLAGVLGAAFVVTLFAVQWPFADLLQSRYARNPFFGQHLRPYMIGPESRLARGEYVDPESGLTLLRGLAIALGLAVLSARLGLAWGTWMAKVRR